MCAILVEFRISRSFFYLMPIYSNNASCSTELFKALNNIDGFFQVSTSAKNYLLVVGVCKNVSILGFKALCIDINLKWLSLCSSAIEGNHICIKQAQI